MWVSVTACAWNVWWKPKQTLGRLAGVLAGVWTRNGRRKKQEGLADRLATCIPALLRNSKLHKWSTHGDVIQEIRKMSQDRKNLIKRSKCTKEVFRMEKILLQLPFIHSKESNKWPCSISKAHFSLCLIN
jgi:hypothetical protein